MKKGNKKVVWIVGGIVTVVVGVLAFFAVRDLGQERALKEEIEMLNELDVTKDRYNTPIKTRGNYAVVEETIKKYLDDYAVSLQKTLKLIGTEKLQEILTIENLIADGKEFKTSMAFLTSFKTEVNTELDKVVAMTSEKAMMSYIEKKKLSQSFVDLYKELALGGIDSSFFQEATKSLDESKKKLNTQIEVEEQALQFLIDNQDNWYIEENSLYFKTQDLADQYNKIVENIS